MGLDESQTDTVRREHVSAVSPQVNSVMGAYTVSKVDDVQRLNTDRAAGAEVADNIKTFAENLDATMLFAGISLETAPLFSGENGEQWRKRTRPINLSNYSLSNDADHKEWVQLVASFERILPLPLHEHGMLERHADDRAPWRGGLRIGVGSRVVINESR